MIREEEVWRTPLEEDQYLTMYSIIFCSYEGVHQCTESIDTWSTSMHGVHDIHGSIVNSTKSVEDLSSVNQL